MPAFSQVYPTLDIAGLRAKALAATDADVRRVLARGRASSLEDFSVLISPAATAHLEQLSQLSRAATQRFFGRTIRLFAPIYLSNECINVCKYCGFSRHNSIPRITISIDQAEREVRMLAARGFRSLLLVAGEHPKFVSNGYVEETIRRMLPIMPGVSLELGPLETQDYAPMVRAGAEGLVVYQETYHEPTYRDLHTAGPKKHFGWRMDTPERGYAAGFRRLGLGALFGLHEWRFEALSLAAHALHLLRTCWKAHVTIALPRMRPAAGEWHPASANYLPDREFVQALCAMRLLLPHCGIVLSTREPPHLRDGLVRLGITMMSAGASTEPGGYSHFDPVTWKPAAQPGEQFHIGDERPPHEIAAMIRRQGYEPVWKDFDQALVASGEPALAG